MVKIKVKNLLEKNKMSRYKFKQLTQWNQARVNAFYFGTVKQITIVELETMCKLFKCDIQDIIEIK